MKIGIVYGSLTGHSKKIANAIASTIKAEAQNVKTKPEFKKLDLLFVIGGIYAGTCNKRLLKYVQTLDKTEIKRVALITSCASGEDHQAAIKQAIEDKGIPVLESDYVCRGNFLFFGLGHPSEDEVAGAVTFAKETLQKLKAK
jgi:flavodoxin